MDYSSFTLLGVVLIVVLGVAFSIYSICKGCSGLQQRGMTTRSTFLSPTTIIVQRLRAHQANTARPYTISGQDVGDKSPPCYEELFAPPPSYEESMKLNQLAQEKENTSAESTQVTITIHPPLPTPKDERSSNVSTETSKTLKKSPVLEKERVTLLNEPMSDMATLQLQ